MASPPRLVLLNPIIFNLKMLSYFQCLIYLVAIKADRLPTDHQIIIVDGTVPHWKPKPGNLYWDHHRLGGADVQMDEIFPPQTRSLIEEQSTTQPPCFAPRWWMPMPAVRLLGCSYPARC